ncbi:hypothetical protein PG997_001821 [Apiospora hydei]|uniref:Uncharacterized protein n=1 Tax=Apiospora hydei TaxID=1337664 RepID=A0ABR1X7W0_9PEZI
MDSVTPGPEVYRAIDYARVKLEDEFEKLNMREAIFHGHATKTYTPIKEERRAKMWANMDIKGLTLEEAIAKALDLVFEYWKKTNRSLISEARMPGRKDITAEAQMKVLKVKIIVLGELKKNPELFQEGERQVTPALGDGTDRQDAEESPSRRPRQQQHQQEMPDNRGEQAVPNTYLSRNLRPRPGNAARDQAQNDAAPRLPDLQHQLQTGVQEQHRGGQTGAGLQEGRPRGRGRGGQNQPRPHTRNYHDQRSGVEPVQMPADASRAQQVDRFLDSIMVRTDPSPVSEAPRSDPYRPGPRGQDTQAAHRAQPAHPTTPTNEGPRRNPRRGANRRGLEPANNNANTSPERPPPRRTARPRKGGPARNNPSSTAPPTQQNRATPHLLDKIDRQSEDIKQRLEKLEANIRSQERAIRGLERECNDARRVAADMRRALSALDEVAPRP